MSRHHFRRPSCLRTASVTAFTLATSLAFLVSGAARRSRERVGELGMATAEYAVVTVAACGFAGLLLAIVRSGEVRALLLGIIKRALAV